MKKFWIALFLLLSLSGTGNAAKQNSAETAYQQGQYDQAIELAGPTPGFNLLMIEAEARLARVSLGSSPHPDRDLSHAKEAAKQALVLYPDRVRPRYALIAVIGFQARRKSLFTGYRKKWAAKGRALIDETLILAPDDPWPFMLSGNWHLEILRRTSTRRARFVGATARAGLTDCNKAIQLAPDDAKITAQCGLALLGADLPVLDALGWRALELASVTEILEDHFTCLRQEQARRVLLEKTEKGVDPARKLALAFLLGKPPRVRVTDWPRQCARPTQPDFVPVSGPDIQG